MLNITEDEFDKLAAYIHSNYGIYLTDKKKLLMTGRLSNLLEAKAIHNFTDYYNYVISDCTGQAVTELVDKMTTNHTYFMREVDHFHYFRDSVLPYLSNAITDCDLRVWSAGCSSGEEPYTLSMIIHDFFGCNRLFWNTQLLATDISHNILEKAIAGTYTESGIALLPPNWKKKYFKSIEANEYVISETIKNDVVFQRFNLMEPVFPFKKRFHVIFCRNVMIYFDEKTKEELVHKFYEMTEPGGYLFIGHSESLNRAMTDFKYIMPAVYRKEL